MLARQRARWCAALDGFERYFGPGRQVRIYTAPGRAELGGNHTDHQHGYGLAAAVGLDLVAVAAQNDDRYIRVKSWGFNKLDVIDLDQSDLQSGESTHSASLIRGLAEGFRSMGREVGGYDAYTTSDVLRGSGLSSSAAFEMGMGAIMNGEFGCGLTAAQVARLGQYAENIYFGKPSGLLDQMASSVGAMVTVDFKDNAVPMVERVDFDFAATGYALCIIDSGADHADLTDEYAAVTAELGEVCACFDKKVLREVPEADFYARLPEVRAKAGDRAVLRAIHVYEDNRRVERQVEALRSGDFPAFLALVRDSGLSSWRFLQNVVPAGYTRHQEVALALALAEKLLDGRGACRVHGGGFAGTIQAFVPFDLLERFRSEMDRVLGTGACHVLSIRPVGGVRLA